MTGPGVFADLDANVAAGSDRSGSPRVSDFIRTLLTARYVAVLLHRIAERTISVPLVPLMVKQLNQFLTGADIAPQARIGPGLVLYHPNGVVIGAGARIGRDVVVQQGVTVGGMGGPRSAGLTRTDVGDRVFLGAGSRVLGAISIGNDVIVGANAVVTKSVPNDSVAVGVPASHRERHPGPHASADGPAESPRTSTE